MSKPFKPVLAPEERDELITELRDENNKLRANRDELRNEWGLTADALRRAIGFWQQAAAERDTLREFIEDLRMQAVHADSADLNLANEYIIARCEDALAKIKGGEDGVV